MEPTATDIRKVMETYNVDEARARQLVALRERPLVRDTVDLGEPTLEERVVWQPGDLH